MPGLSGSFLIAPIIHSFKYGDELDFTIKIFILIPVILRVVTSVIFYEFIFTNYFISDNLS